jgi:hypothetical protein
MSPVSLAFEGTMARPQLAALLDATGVSSPMSPRPLLGAAALAVPPVSPAFAEASRVLAAPRTNLTLRMWSDEDACIETSILFPGLPGGGRGVALNPQGAEYRIAGYIDPEAVLALLAPMLPPELPSGPAGPLPAFAAQLGPATMAVLAACLDLVRRDVLERRATRVLDKAPPPAGFREEAPPLSGEHVTAYLAHMWGLSRFDQLITYVLPLSLMPRPPSPGDVAAGLRELQAGGLLDEVRPDRWQPLPVLRPLVTAFLGASAGFQWQRISQAPADALLIVERVFMLGAGGVALEFRQASEGVLRLATCSRAEIVDFLTDELAVASVPPPPAAREAAKFCGQCGAPLQPDGKFCGECGAPVEVAP